MSQYITHDYKNVSQLFEDIEALYRITSQPVVRLFTEKVSSACEPLVRIFNEYYPEEQLELVPRQYRKLHLPQYDKQNLILCFSGGKDSVAAALHYKKRYNVYLYHMKGINKGYADEYLKAEKLARVLGLPIYMDSVSLHGSHRFTEHFMKNVLIANGAIHYGIQNNIGIKVAFGNYYTSYLQDNVFDVCAGDCIEMWKAYERTVRNIIPGFKVYVGLKNIATSYKTLLKNTQYLPELVSCVGPYRYREYWKKEVEKKYNVELLPNRCGRCWKCCAEYIYFTDHDVLQYNEEYYDYCLEQLLKTQYKEKGYGSYNIYQLWYSYLFYPITKSKRKGIQDAVVRSRKIKYPEK